LRFQLRDALGKCANDYVVRDFPSAFFKDVFKGFDDLLFGDLRCVLLFVFVCLLIVRYRLIVFMEL